MKKLVFSVVASLIIMTGVIPSQAAARTSMQDTSSIGASKVNVSIIVNGSKVQLERQPVAKNNRTLVPARTVLKKLGASVDWYSQSGLIKIVKGNTIIHMKVGDRSLKINGKQSKMDVEPVLVNGTVLIPINFAAKALNYNIIWDVKNNAVRVNSKVAVSVPSRGIETGKFKVVIDAGHGGKDPGAVYNGIREKDLNLDIAKKLNMLLLEEGISTQMTRFDDNYLGLHSRSYMANNLKADLLVSIHNNSGNTKTNGTMTLYYPGTENSNGRLTAKEFAEIVQKELVSKLGTKNLGTISRPNLAVLRTSSMPAVIAEIGYITHSSELSRLRTDDYRQAAAEALKNAVIEALGQI